MLHDELSGGLAYVVGEVGIAVLSQPVREKPVCVHRERPAPNVAMPTDAIVSGEA